MTTSFPTAFWRGSVGTSGTGFGLTADMAKKARGRVKWFAFAMMAMSLIGTAFLIVWLALGLEPAAQYENLYILMAHAAVAGGIWRAARLPRFSDNQILASGLVLEILLCMGAAFGTNLSTYQHHGAVAEMSWVTPIIILFPLIVPFPPKRMLVASLLAAATEPLSVVLLWQVLGVEPAPEHMMVAIYPTLAAGLAYYASHIIWGLNQQLRRAAHLGSYRLEERLGRGGMGEVWRASHQLLARPAAVKFIPAELLAEDVDKAQVVMDRFEHEAQVTASLRSPHTVQLYDFGRADNGAFYYVMELLDGVDLNTLVESFGPQAPGRVVHMLSQVCHSLAEAHQARLIHRDIKPANLLVCRYGMDYDFVKVLDFGLVKQVRDEDGDPTQLTQHGMLVGTPAFMAPEMALGDGAIDARADLYALGCVAYWLLTGMPVFAADSPLEVLTKHLREEPLPPSGQTELAIPPELDALVLSCLAKEPSGRPQTATELARRLEAISLQRPWTREEAQRWWQAHQPAKS